VWQSASAASRGPVFHAQRRGLGAFLDLQALVLQLQAMAFGHGPVEVGEQAARLVLHMHQVQRAGQHGQQQDQVEPRHGRLSCAPRA
jgi:hypothetical protein